MNKWKKKAKPVKGWGIVDIHTGKFIAVYPEYTRRQAYCAWRVVGTGECERIARIRVIEG